MTVRISEQRKSNSEMGLDLLRSKPSLPMVGMLLVEMIIGYEWLISGITKIVRGDFPSGLAEELIQKSEGLSGWFAGFLNGVVIPNAVAFGYLIEFAELAAGIVLVVAPLIWLFRWERVSDNTRSTIMILVAVAAIAGIIMAISFHLANADPHPWLLPGDSFDEGVDLDSVLPAIQFIILTVNLVLFTRLRKTKASIS
jgi:thiosulfate dehydrogenase [quinone] large subunit